MSFVSSRNNVRAKVKKWCCLCGEIINVGDMKDVRSGTADGSVFTMHMHPECHAHESRAGVMDQDWYEDISEPAFDRADAIAASLPNNKVSRCGGNEAAPADQSPKL